MGIGFTGPISPVRHPLARRGEGRRTDSMLRWSVRARSVRVRISSGARPHLILAERERLPRTPRVARAQPHLEVVVTVVTVIIAERGRV
eukprot:1764329-Prymnesium_polylepis.1